MQASLEGDGGLFSGVPSHQLERVNWVKSILFGWPPNDVCARGSQATSQRSASGSR